MARAGRLFRLRLVGLLLGLLVLFPGNGAAFQPHPSGSGDGSPGIVTRASGVARAPNASTLNASTPNAITPESTRLATTNPPSPPYPLSPILRLESGVHMAGITGLAVDAAERFVVTGSSDKTVRIWSLPDLKLIRTIRLPIGMGPRQGRVYTVAISPDGSTIAAGGWTEENSVYLLDRASGALKGRIKGLPDCVNLLAFSPDGQRLAVGLSVGGLGIYRVADLAPLSADTDYKRSCYGMHFDPAGNLVVSSLDGDLRLYDSAGKRAARLAAPGGGLPRHVRFSPDGAKIAVSYQDINRLDILSGRDLTALYSIGGAKVSGLVSTLFWSKDGTVLSAGQTGKIHDEFTFRSWSDQGRGGATDTPAGDTLLTGAIALKDDAILFAAGSTLKVLRGGRLSAQSATEIVDLRDQDFQVNGAGNEVQSAEEDEDEDGEPELVRFSVTERALRDTPADEMHPPRQSVPGMLVALKPVLSLNDRPLPVEKGETASCLAISPDGDRLIIGTDFNLRAYDRSGSPRWMTATPERVFNVNITGDGRLAVALLADGTVRWYQLDSGKERLALFLHHDERRWVMWTPGGYFDASPGGSELIGWHINRGPDLTPDFFPVARFSEHFRRPDVIARVLDAADEAEALRQADAVLGRTAETFDIARLAPPAVNILSPAPDATVPGSELRVLVSVRSPSGAPITDSIVQFDGVNVPASQLRKDPLTHEEEALAQQQTDAQVWALVVQNPPMNDFNLSFLARSQSGFSVPARLRLKRPATAPPVPTGTTSSSPSQSPSRGRPDLYVLAIGVSTYQNPAFNLGLANKDAEGFASELKKQAGKLYQNVDAQVLTDKEANRAEIMKRLEWLKRVTTQKDVAMLFIAGHGKASQSGRYYFLPHDFDEDALAATSISNDDILDFLNHGTGKRILFLDTCHAGSVMGTSGKEPADLKTRGVRAMRSASLDGLIDELSAAENGMVVFTAARGDQLSLEKTEWGHGAFTRAVLDGFQGGAAPGKAREIWVVGMESYVSTAVRGMTGRSQQPMTFRPATMPDFPMAVVVGR